MEETIQNKAKIIKAIITDVDGVLTDGKLTFDNEAMEFKSFNVKDGQIVKHLKDKGIVVGIITGRRSQVVINRCVDLKIDFHRHGVSDKLKEYNNFKQKYNLCDNEIAYIGDDIIDIPILERCGLSIVPSDARIYMKELVDIVTFSKGGEGVFRDVADIVLEAKGFLLETLNSYKLLP
jgi:3-deoxy-D-manno-octulosonate 8-phosphate phosphatase (KDO 8-P phosphatase)